MRWLLTGVLVAAACGGRTSTPIVTTTTPRPRPQDPAPPPNPSGPSEADCDTLFAHALDILFAERQPPPSLADQDQVSIELRPAFIADCRAGTRDYQQCGLAAKSRAELEGCKRATEPRAARLRTTASRSAG
jgi:hypothetical protein